MNGLQVVNGGPGEASERRSEVSEVSELRGCLILCPCGVFRSQNNLQRKGGFVSTVFLVDLTISYNKQVRLQTRSVAGFISPNKHIMLVDAMAPWSPTD